MWYDVFALFYDRSLEKRYRPSRAAAVAALEAAPGSLVLDMACGTGQNFAPVLDVVGPTGALVGVDLSEGMLRQARRRIRREGWENVHLVRADARTFGPEALDAVAGQRTVDGMLCTLGMTVMDGWQDAFRQGFDLVRPGGRIVLFDAYIEKPVLQTWGAALVARADLSRRFWEPLEAVAEDVRLDRLPGSPHEFGGHLYLASGTKPARP